MSELKNVHEVEVRYTYGEVIRIIKYLENAEGEQRLVSETVVEPNGSFMRMLFDERGDLIETLRYDAHGKLVGRAPAGGVPESRYYAL